MNCPQVKKFLSEYLDNQLNHSLQREVEAHLKACASCRRELETSTKALRILKSLSPLNPPPLNSK